MKRVDSVISLIYSMSKAEKKAFSVQMLKDKEEKDYLVIYDIITKSKQLDSKNVKGEFHKRRPGGSFEVSIQYLYERLTDSLLTLRKKKDIYYDLLNNLCKARMLYERSLFEECFEILSDTIEQATYYENNEVLTIALKLELEYLLRLNFPNLAESELYHKHFMQNEALKKTRKIVEQSSLHNLLKYRLSHIGSIRTSKQKQDMNDLMVNELSIAASSGIEGNFELMRNHRLFQANYLMGAGEYKAALNSYKELSRLFEQNRQFWSNPPIYYLSAIQGILDSLCIAGLYHETPFFLSKLEELTQNEYSTEFILHLKTLIYIYKSNSLLQAGNFEQALELRDKQENELLKKVTSLGLESQLRLYLSFAVLGMYTKDYVQARKYMKKIFSLGKLFCAFPSYKIARLVNLLLQAELGNYDFFENEIISIKRNIRFEKQTYITEKLIFKFIQGYPLPSYEKARNKRWLQYQKDIQKIEQETASRDNKITNSEI